MIGVKKQTKTNSSKSGEARIRAKAEKQGFEQKRRSKTQCAPKNTRPKYITVDVGCPTKGIASSSSNFPNSKRRLPKAPLKRIKRSAPIVTKVCSVCKGRFTNANSIMKVSSISFVLRNGIYCTPFDLVVTSRCMMGCVRDG